MEIICKIPILKRKLRKYINDLVLRNNEIVCS